ncbi:hypothetical protein BH23GEM2_BH23GEM2_16510 [soil metagenome]
MLNEPWFKVYSPDDLRVGSFAYRASLQVAYYPAPEQEMTTGAGELHPSEPTDTTRSLREMTARASNPAGGTQAATAPRSATRITWVVPVVFIALFAGVSWSLRAPGVTMVGDDALYLFLSESVRGFRGRLLHDHVECPPPLRREFSKLLPAERANDACGRKRVGYKEQPALRTVTAGGCCVERGCCHAARTYLPTSRS